MIEILGNNLSQLFNNITLNGVCTYKGKRYEVWEVSDEVFNVMCDMSEDKFVELAGKDAWWRHSDGSNLGTPDSKVYVNGCEMFGWAGETWDDEDENDEFEVYASNLSNYLCDVIGASQPRNVCAVAVDLAKYNNMKLSELFRKYEG